MKKILGSLILAMTFGCAPRPAPAPARLMAPDGALKISGPFVHEHLAVYLVENPSAKSLGEFITLAEGLASGKVKVTEKKNAQVNELLIENGSDKPCFVQAGDVVKGGQQDRTLGTDMILTKAMGNQPIASFCVEHGRWTGRDGESSAYFDTSDAMVVGGAMKLASNAS